MEVSGSMEANGITEVKGGPPATIWDSKTSKPCVTHGGTITIREIADICKKNYIGATYRHTFRSTQPRVSEIPTIIPTIITAETEPSTTAERTKFIPKHKISS